MLYLQGLPKSVQQIKTQSPPPLVSVAVERSASSCQGLMVHVAVGVETYEKGNGTRGHAELSGPTPPSGPRGPRAEDQIHSSPLFQMQQQGRVSRVEREECPKQPPLEYIRLYQVSQSKADNRPRPLVVHPSFIVLVRALHVLTSLNRSSAHRWRPEFDILVARSVSSLRKDGPVPNLATSQALGPSLGHSGHAIPSP